jgi:hypothetical protein
MADSDRSGTIDRGSTYRTMQKTSTNFAPMEKLHYAAYKPMAKLPPPESTGPVQSPGSVPDESTGPSKD